MVMGNGANCPYENSLLLSLDNIGSGYRYCAAEKNEDIVSYRFITTDGTDILDFSHIGYAPSLMERSLFSGDEFDRNIVPFLKKKYYDTPGLQVDRYIAQRGEWYFFFRIFSDTQLLGYVAIVTDDKKAFNDLTEALPSLEAGTQMMSCVLHDVSIQ